MKTKITNVINNMKVRNKMLILYFVLLLLYIILAVTGIYIYYYIIQACTALIVIISLSLFVYLSKSNKFVYEDKYRIYFKLVLFLGIVMRVCITLYSDCRFYTYDMGDYIYNSVAGSLDFVFNPHGHGGYIRSILGGHLPDSYEYQFYQQPLFYLLGGFTSFIANLFINDPENAEYFMVDPAKIVSCMASCINLYVFVKLLDKTKITDNGKLLSLSFVTFYPGLIFLSSRVSVDTLTMLFMSLTLLYTLNWHEEHSIKNTILLALFYGLAAMTKISGVIFAPLTLIIVLLALIKKDMSFHDWIKKVLLFLVISLPVGLWYNVRNYLKFGMPFGYVYPQTEDMVTYAGDHSLFERFIYSSDVVSDVVVDLHTNSNFHSFFYKTSLYGSITFAEIKETMVGMFLFAFGIGIVLFSLFSIINAFIKHRHDYVGLFSLLAIFIYLIAAMFYYKEPYTCSMDFRYMSIIVIPIALVVGSQYDEINNKLIKDLSELLFVLFFVFSVSFYLITVL